MEFSVHEHEAHLEVGFVHMTLTDDDFTFVKTYEFPVNPKHVNAYGNILKYIREQMPAGIYGLKKPFLFRISFYPSDPVFGKPFIIYDKFLSRVSELELPTAVYQSIHTDNIIYAIIKRNDKETYPYYSGNDIRIPDEGLYYVDVDLDPVIDFGNVCDEICKLKGFVNTKCKI